MNLVERNKRKEKFNSEDCEDVLGTVLNRIKNIKSIFVFVSFFFNIATRFVRQTFNIK